MGHRGLFGPGLADIARRRTPRIAALGGGVIVVAFFFKLDHRAAGGVDIVFVFISAGFKLDFIYQDAVLGIELGFSDDSEVSRHVGVLQGERGRLFRGDIRFVTGLARRSHRLHLGILRHQEIELVDRKPRQRIKGVGGIFRGNPLDQLRLAQRNPVLLRELLQGGVGRHRLAQDGSAEGVGTEQAVDFTSQLFP